MCLNRLFTCFNGVVLLLLISGCVCFKVDSNIVSEKDTPPRVISSKHITQEYCFSPFSLVVNQPQKNVWTSSLSLRTDIEENLAVDRTTTTYNKYFLIGFYPGVCSHWAIGESTDSSNSYISDAVVFGIGIPIINVLSIGIPTWYGWFEEYDADWKPAFTANKGKKTQKVIGTVEDIRSDVPFRMVQGSLLGWAKTGKQSVGKPVTNNYTVRRKEGKGVANAVAKLSISGTSFSWTDVTNGEGLLTIDPAIIPIRTKTPLVVHAEYPEISSVIKPQEISIPAECFGVSLFNNDVLRSMRFNKFVDYDTEVDFPFIPDQEAPRLVVNVENKNIGTGSNVRQISITITNQGNGPCYRLLGKISSDSFAPLKDKLLIYGTIPPGHSETRSLTVEVPSPGWNNVSFPFSVNFWNANMVTLAPQNDSIEIKSIPRPRLVISTNIEKKQVAVPSINKGDAFCMVVSVTNTGTMPAHNVKLTMLLPEDKSLKSFTAGVQSIADELVPGATTVCRFQLVSKRDNKNTNSPICTFEASETDPHCSEQKKVTIPIDDLP